MIFDFALILVVATVVTGVVWAFDAWFLKPRRVARGQSGGEPVIVEYCRSFFPIILIVLLVRSFLFEPFRIPSDSMMPTLLDGDFIFVNKYAYGMRLPVINRKVIEFGEPERGDVIVFRLPSDPATNYIKRVVGLPGDVVETRDSRLYINGEVVQTELVGEYDQYDVSANLIREQLGDRQHELLMSRTGYGRDGKWRVPEGHYFVMGDNRNNSRDSRFPQVGPIPEELLVGRAVRIWMNWDFPNESPEWGRIGQRIN